MPRIYERKFDHAEARALYAAGGWSYATLAARYGVSGAAICHAVTPEKDAGRRERGKKWRTTICEACDGPAMKLVGGKAKNNPDGRVLCAGCRGKARRESVRFDPLGRLLSVKCETCREWFAPDSFPRGIRYRDLREGGFHNACRGCQTTLKREYRERNKVPCSGCGVPSLPPREKPGRAVIARCRDCYHASRARHPMLPVYVEAHSGVVRPRSLPAAP